MSTINVNGMTQTYNRFLNQYSTKNKTEKNMADTIMEKLQEKDNVTAEVTKIAETKEISTKDMTLEEYKSYIHDKISSMPLHPSQMNGSYSIQISEAGFEAMQNDPEYEKWVLDSIKTNFDFNDTWAPICGGCYCILVFGATEDEGYGQSWYPGYQNGNGGKIFDEKSKDSFWERRADRKRQQEIIEKSQEKRRLQRELAEKEALEESFAHARMMSQWRMDDLFSSGSSNITFDRLNGMSSTSASAVAAYEANIMTVGNPIV